jgi:hypothetical protein
MRTPRIDEFGRRKGTELICTAANPYHSVVLTFTLDHRIIPHYAT